MSLRARDLAVAPPGAPDPAVRGFSLEVVRGEWVALSGPNGCGKTSVMLALAGLLPPLAGEVTLGGEPVARARARGAVAAVMQEPASQLLERTVASELAFAARNLGHPEARIAEETRRWAARLGLEPELECDPRALSAGRQQLVLIAAALVAGPEFLAADEAGAHLDREARARLCEELRREAKAGLGVLWVTQDPEEIARSDRAVVMGEASASTSPPCFPRPHPGDIALGVRVAPWDGRPGPHVHCEHPFTIETPARGVTALVGRNGSGKSVLLSAAAGLMSLVQVELSPYPLHLPPIMAVQYPELQTFEERVREEVAFAAVSRGEVREDVLARAAGAFERLGLAGRSFLERRSFHLSAGEKRLLQAVGALLAPASLVILDEPTAGLDAERRRALAGLVAERANETPVLVASQDSEWLRWLGARVHAIGDYPREETSSGLTETYRKV